MRAAGILLSLRVSASPREKILFTRRRGDAEEACL
jgi:hypothetical protein